MDFNEYFCSVNAIENMAQLLVNVEEGFPLLSLKRAISLLRGVTTVCEKKENISANKSDTLKAMADAKAGNTVKFASFEDYLEYVKE